MSALHFLLLALPGWVPGRCSLPVVTECGIFGERGQSSVAEYTFYPQKVLGQNDFRYPSDLLVRMTPVKEARFVCRIYCLLLLAAILTLSPVETNTWQEKEEEAIHSCLDATMRRTTGRGKSAAYPLLRQSATCPSPLLAQQPVSCLCSPIPSPFVQPCLLEQGPAVYSLAI